MNTIIDDLKLNKISDLDLECENINTETIVKIAKILSTNTSLHTLNLNGNNIGVEGAVEIAKLLKSNYSLTYFSSNYINKTIIKILERNKKIVENSRFMRTKSAHI